MLFPYFKKEDKSQQSNYRPVALLSCIGKLQEKAVFKNMNTFLLDNKLLYKYQSGLLPHHLTFLLLIDIFIIYARPLLIICSLALYSVMCQNRLIESGMSFFYPR